MIRGSFTGSILRAGRKSLAAGVFERMSRDPGAGDGSFLDVTTHAEGLLDHLAVAQDFAQPDLFRAHVAWLAESFVARGVALERLRASLACLEEVVRAELPPESAAEAARCVQASRAELDMARARRPDPAAQPAPHAHLTRAYVEAALEGRRAEAIAIATGAVDAGVPSAVVYAEVLAAAQIEIGLLWQRGEIHVGEEHLASRITEAAMSAIQPRLPRAPRNGRRVLLTSASGDLHDIGLRMVADHLDAGGFDAVFLGADVPPADVARAALDHEVALLAIGAKLVLHLRATADVIADVENALPELPVLVGGAPFALAADLWRAVGADGYARTAADAVPIAAELVARGRALRR